MQIKKTVLAHFNRSKLRLSQSKIVFDVFLSKNSNPALSVLNGFGFLIYPRYIGETLAMF